MEGSLRNLVGSLFVAQELDSEQGKRALNGTHQATCRLEAKALGFRPLGYVLEASRPRTISFPTEVWVHDELGVYLSLVSFSFNLHTRLTTGLSLLTWGHMGASAAYGNDRVQVDYAPEGSVREVLAFHLRRVSGSGQAVDPRRDLELRRADIERFYREDVPWGNLLAAALLPLSAILAAALTLAAVGAWCLTGTSAPPALAFVIVILALPGLLPGLFGLLVGHRPPSSSERWLPARTTLAPAPPANPLGLDVTRRQSSTRCPFCHDAVQAGAVNQAVCGSCFASHHAECWGAYGRCATCAGERALVPALGASSQASPPAARPCPKEAA